MPALLDRPRFGSMAETSSGAEMARRRTRLGMTINHLAKESGVDRETITKLEKGGGRHRDSTIGALLSTLSRLEHEMGVDLPAASSDLAAEGLVEFAISGSFGVSIIMKGPVKNVAEMEAAASRLVEKMQAERRETD